MPDPVAGKRTWTPTGAAYDDRDLLAEALRQLYAAANKWRGEPELERALDAAREALSASHWPTRWQANPDETSSSASSQPTWTLFVCPECRRAGAEAAWCYGYPVKHPRQERIPVEVVELSRLRAAEEERLTDEQMLDIVGVLDFVLSWGHSVADEGKQRRLKDAADRLRAGAVKAEADKETRDYLKDKLHHTRVERDRLAEALKEAWEFMGRDRYYAPPELERKVREALASPEGGNDG